jgi:hypothetical protein
MLVTVSADPVKKKKYFIQLIEQELEALKERLPILRNIDRIQTTQKGKKRSKAKTKSVRLKIREKQKKLREENMKLRKLRNG